jgi:uncharacterized protein
MRSALLCAALLWSGAVRAGEPAIPKPEGFVTDRAGVVGAAARARIVGLAGELQAKTGAEIAVVTVSTTAPLDDFTYALRVAEAWKPGRKGDDTGVVFLVAVEDRKLRILVGYGLEGILPDGLVGEISDREVVPAFRAGRVDEGIWRGVAALAARIAEARGVTLTGVPPPQRDARGAPLPTWALILILLVVLAIMLYQANQPRRFRGGGGLPYGGGLGGFGGGFGGGGGGFDGFGGGSFGGGGAGRSW